MHSAILGEGGFVCYVFNNADRNKCGIITLTISKDPRFLLLNSRSVF